MGPEHSGRVSGARAVGALLYFLTHLTQKAISPLRTHTCPTLPRSGKCGESAERIS